MGHDLIVVGRGPGGYVAAIRAAQLGYKVGIVEKENLGGICLNWGCIPTKALLKTASVYESFTHASDYGIVAGEFKPDFGAVIKRSRGVADKMSKGIQFLMKKNKIEVIMGMGRLNAKKEVEVTGADGVVTTHQAKHVVLATGARSRQLPNLPIDEKAIKEFIKKYNFEDWTNCWDDEHIGDWRGKFDVYSTPTIYLMDEKKIIRGKRLDHTNIASMINILENKAKEKEKAKDSKN
jgi:dihydrolipoamide dehydrogenase